MWVIVFLSVWAIVNKCAFFVALQYQCWTGPRDGLVHGDWSHHSIYWGVNKHCTCRISFSKDVRKNTFRENLQQRSKTQNSFNTVTLCQMFHNLNFDILQCFFFLLLFNLGSVGCVLPSFSSCFSHFNPATKFCVDLWQTVSESVMWKLVSKWPFCFCSAHSCRLVTII